MQRATAALNAIPRPRAVRRDATPRLHDVEDVEDGLLTQGVAMPVEVQVQSTWVRGVLRLDQDVQTDALSRGVPAMLFTREDVGVLGSSCVRRVVQWRIQGEVRTETFDLGRLHPLLAKAR